MPSNGVYDLESVKLPRLAGFLLRLFAALLESPLTRPLLIGTFMDNGGITKLRGLPVDDPPTFLPVTPLPAEPPGSPPGLADIPAPPTAGPGFHFAAVRDYACAYRSRELTPEVIAGRVLEAIAASDRRDPPLRAFIAVDPEDVLAQARESTRRLEAGQPLSIFDGVPVAVKDEVDMLPFPTTVGTKFLGRNPASADATVVARLRAAGALLIGKTNMHEIGIMPTGFNPHHGTPRNPYNSAHYTGGSSSGSAAAVGAGLAPVAVGADAGGSIRVPAGFCGVVGLKPTYGRISEHGAAPLCWSMGHLGPIAATAQDAALAYAVMAGPDPLDRLTLSQPPVTLDGIDSADLTGVTLGIYRPWFEHASPDIVATCDRVLEELQERGAALREVVIPELDAMRVAHVITILSEMSAALDRHYHAHRRDLDHASRVLMAMARSFTGRDYVHAQRVRTRAIRHLDAALQTVDAIVTPTTAVSAPAIPADAFPIGESDTSTVTEIMRFVYAANFSGLPAITFPAGYDASGLPVGLQAMARPWQEPLLLRLAAVAGTFVERRPPQVFTDLLAG